MRVCNGVCSRYKVKGKYCDGFMRCGICGIFMHVEGNYCPCCRSRLGTKPVKKSRKYEEGVKRI